MIKSGLLKGVVSCSLIYLFLAVAIYVGVEIFKVMSFMWKLFTWSVIG